MGVGTTGTSRACAPTPAADAEVRRLAGLLTAILEERAEQEHELRTALLAVEAAGRALAARATQRHLPRDADLAIAIQSEAARLRQLVSRAPDAPGAVFGVHDALRPLVATHRARGQRIALGISPALLVVGRQQALVEVVANLLANSARHAPGARVTLSSPPPPAPGIVRVLVADDGPGFPAAAFGHAAERGWRDPGVTVPGSGLGLYVSARLMEREGGALTLLRPSPGSGGAVVALDLRAGPHLARHPLESLADAS